MNKSYLDNELRLLRLVLRRRVMWLRKQWAHDPLQSYRAEVVSEAQADRLLAGEEPLLEADFYQQDAGVDTLNQLIASLEQELAEQRQIMEQLNAPPVLEILVRLLGLTPFERKVVLLCLAPEMEPGFGQLYAYVQDDLNSKHPTPHLALTLFGGEGDEWVVAHHSFHADAPLRHFHLVVTEPNSSQPATHMTRPLYLHERITGYLLGINRPDRRIADLLRPVPGAILTPLHGGLVESIGSYYGSGGDRTSWPVLNIIGPAGVGKRNIARALCDRLGFQLWSLDTGRLPATATERQEILRLLEREAVLLQAALYLDLAGPNSGDASTADGVKDVIERLDAFLIIGSRERRQIEREAVAVQVPKLGADARLAQWEQALRGVRHSLNGTIEQIVQQFDFGPHAIVQAVGTAMARARLRGEIDGSLRAEDLWEACREQADWHLDDLAQRIQPCYTWDDIVLPDDVFNQLQEIAAQVANRGRVYETWGFGAKLSRGRGIGALFSGSSGTGKTMSAEILANHLKLDLYRIDLSGVVSKYIGETEKNLRKVFDAAEQSGAILFFDEADAIFGKRTEVKDSHDRYANIEINYLLQRIEDYRGLAILATNRKSDLDWAFLRRLRFLVDFPFPDGIYRRQIWGKVFPSQAPLDRLDYDSLARMEIPGGHIKNIALNAAFLAAGENTPISMSQVIRAAQREYQKMDKLITEAEFGDYYSRAVS